MTGIAELHAQALDVTGRSRAVAARSPAVRWEALTNRLMPQHSRSHYAGTPDRTRSPEGTQVAVGGLDLPRRREVR